MSAMRVDVWSDVACPWCYVGKRRLEAAIATSREQPVEVVWHSFELDPSARVSDGTVSYAARLARKYHTTDRAAELMIERMTKTGAADGLELRFDRIRPTNTFDAHRVIQLALERGLADAMVERVFRAYFTEGLLVSDHEVLAELAIDVGLAPGEVREMLGTTRYTHEVRTDELEAREIGITGVPFFVMGARVVVSGAQTPEVLAGALARARDPGTDEPRATAL
jgi:predicted DsbA family dithiol-disulfide isomerase